MFESVDGAVLVAEEFEAAVDEGVSIPVEGEKGIAAGKSRDEISALEKLDKFDFQGGRRNSLANSLGIAYDELTTKKKAPPN